MKKISVQKEGWNSTAAIAGPFWYFQRGMISKGLLLLAICVCTLGIGIIPVWLYCGWRGNKEFYHFLKKRNVYISY